MVGVLAGLTGVFGSLIGSFLNVVIFRLPAGRSIVAPPSACGTCGARIRPWDNVPVLSWLLLRGKCRDCAAAISVRYPLVELGTAVFFAIVAWWILSAPDATSSSAKTSGLMVALVAYLYLAAVSVALALIDMDTHTLPNRIILPAYVVGAVLLTGSSLLGGTPERLLPSLIGAVALFIVYLLLALAYPGGMGLGDVKLAGLLGMYLGWLGWAPLSVGAFSAFVLGGLFSLGLVVTRRATRKSGIPFGPWMLAGAWLGIFLGGTIAAWYLSLFGLA
ncbi:prepilin peptidase [Cryobacterium shii]|uniref:Prepilin leader peptidase/N-methyltransferase n=1 Tax=Cryobacterium shii TaxID=1259235 RepID=A0AAQ2HFV4_9MICO|nr:A24 family peptidase [Cryobacterium shii]TFC47061.1 prepilin peptidase [Cryobacterium shii]